MRRECTIDGCRAPQKGFGYCNRHYIRFKKYGDPLGGGTFWGEPERYLQEAVLPFAGTECLTWPYGRDSRGYAVMRAHGLLFSTKVARAVCEIVNGPPPTAGHHAAHSCGNGHLGCVNPNHLRWATPEENTADAIRHGTFPMGERSGVAVLSASDVTEIRSLAGRVSQRKIAARFGVGKSTIGSIIERRSWAHLGGSRQHSD